MARVRRGRAARWQEVDQFTLKLGWDLLTEGFTREDLLVAWQHQREAMLVEHVRFQPGTRPWAWWEFDANEPRPRLDDQPARLVELGVMSRDELAALDRPDTSTVEAPGALHRT